VRIKRVFPISFSLLWRSSADEGEGCSSLLEPIEETRSVTATGRPNFGAMRLLYNRWPVTARDRLIEPVRAGMIYPNLNIAPNSMK